MIYADLQKQMTKDDHDVHGYEEGCRLCDVGLYGGFDTMEEFILDKKAMAVMTDTGE